MEIWTESLPKDYWWKPNDYVGGTPEYVVNTAENLVKLGYDVLVYYDNEPMEHNGVFYLPRNQFSGSGDVLTCNEMPPKLGTRNISWTSKYGQTQEMYKDCDARIVLSKYHQKLFGEDSLIIPLGYDKDEIYPEKKENFALYSSSPDRGLEFLLKIWPEIYKETGIVLKTSYGAFCGQTSVNGVEFLGKLPKEDINSLYRRAKYWVHPAQGIELFCISGLKAQVAGCRPVYIPNMALGETIKYGVKTNEENFKKDFIEDVKNEKSWTMPEYKDWTEVTSILDKVIKSI